MSVNNRIISIRLMEKIRNYPEFADEIGVFVNTRKDYEEKEIIPATPNMSEE